MTGRGRPQGDAARVARAITGDEEAFRELAARHGPGVFRMNCAMIGNVHLAEDATQEALLEAYRGLSGLRSPEKFGAWLRGIAYRICSDQVRKRAMERIQRPAQAAPKPADEEFHSRVRDRVASLPQKYRDALSMRYLGDLSVKEIAEALGESISNVKVILHRGREMLREGLSELES